MIRGEASRVYSHNACDVKHNMVQNYDVTEEKQDAFSLRSILEDMMEASHIPIITFSYCKFDQATIVSNDAHKLSTDYDASNYMRSSPLWFIISVNSSTNDIRTSRRVIMQTIRSISAVFEPYSGGG